MWKNYFFRRSYKSKNMTFLNKNDSTSKGEEREAVL